MFRAVPNVASRVVDLQSRKADLAVNLTPDAADQVKRDPKLAVLPTPTERIAYLAFNTIKGGAAKRMDDPPEGVIVTANNTVTSAEYPFVSHSMNDCYRSERIHELAASPDPVGPEDMVAWQGDTLSAAARRWASLLAGRGPYTGDAERARAARGRWW